jgi:hypothetical protein
VNAPEYVPLLDAAVVVVVVEPVVATVSVLPTLHPATRATLASNKDVIARGNLLCHAMLLSFKYLKCPVN